MMVKSIQAAVFALAAFPVLAQVEVVDRPVGAEISEPEALTEPAPVVQSGAQNTAEMYYQIQVLQQEVLQLRGLVEEQAHQIKQLKQQRLDDYVDLDRRLSKLAAQSAGGVASASEPKSSSAASKPVTPASVQNSAGEIAHYKSATKLILVDKNYDGGIERLQEHLKLYPNGRYSANAQYWLGEVYLATSKLADARTWFETLLKTYPAHSKVPDAKYKLGTVYYKLDMLPEAKQLLAEVSRSGGNTAQLATRYMKEHNL